MSTCKSFFSTLKINRLSIRNMTIVSILALATSCGLISCNDDDNASNKCGNGKLDFGEVCDGNRFAGGSKVCPDGFVIKNKTGFTCTSTCEIDVSNACIDENSIEKCGNGQLDAGEVCDGSLYAEGVKVCPDGFTVKNEAGFSCTSTCQLNTMNACVRNDLTNSCGNTQLDTGEACDGTLISEKAKVCPEGYVLIHPNGFACNNCVLDVSGACVEAAAPELCGNETLDTGEVCDGDQFVEDLKVCPAGYVLIHPNDFACNSCAIDTSTACVEAAAPELCGNETLDTGEVCDGDQFVEDLKVCPKGYTLDNPDGFACNSCVLDVSAACVEEISTDLCGNETLDADEVCDGNLFKEEAKVCPTGYVLIHPNGFACNSCVLDVSGACVEAASSDLCGNETLDTGEVCDGTEIVEDLKICPAGYVLIHPNDFACNSCAIDTSAACVVAASPDLCGNETLDAGEVCDGDQFVEDLKVCPKGYTLDYPDGFVCNNCVLDDSAACVEEISIDLCGNETLDADEVCDGNLFKEEAKVCPDGYVLIHPNGFACNSCVLDVSGACVEAASSDLCGNETLDAGEVCDGTEIVEDLKVCPAGYVLIHPNDFACNSCAIDTSAACVEAASSDLCGNETLDAGEVCDGTEIVEDLKVCPPGYTLDNPDGFVCNSCAIDFSAACVEEEQDSCGNTQLDDGETCDGNLIREEAKVCPDGYVLIHPNGFACNSCVLDVSGACVEAASPTLCGNETLDAGEVCDGTEIVEDLKVCPAGYTINDPDGFACNNCVLDVSAACVEI